MLYPARNGDAFAWRKLHDPVAEFDPEKAFPHQKEFVFGGMNMPGKFAFHFDELDLLAVEPPRPFWAANVPFPSSRIQGWCLFGRRNRVNPVEAVVGRLRY